MARFAPPAWPAEPATGGDRMRSRMKPGPRPGVTGTVPRRRGVGRKRVSDLATLWARQGRYCTSVTHVVQAGVQHGQAPHRHRSTAVCRCGARPGAASRTGSLPASISKGSMINPVHHLRHARLQGRAGQPRAPGRQACGTDMRRGNRWAARAHPVSRAAGTRGQPPVPGPGGWPERAWPAGCRHEGRQEASNRLATGREGAGKGRESA